MPATWLGHHGAIDQDLVDELSPGIRAIHADNPKRAEAYIRWAELIAFRSDDQLPTTIRRNRTITLQATVLAVVSAVTLAVVLVFLCCW